MGGGQGLVSNRAKCEFANFKWGNFKWHNAQNRRPNLKVDKEGPGICGSSSRMPRCHDTTAGQHGHDGRPAPATKMGSILAWILAKCGSKECTYLNALNSPSTSFLLLALASSSTATLALPMRSSWSIVISAFATCNWAFCAYNCMYATFGCTFPVHSTQHAQFVAYAPHGWMCTCSAMRKAKLGLLRRGLTYHGLSTLVNHATHKTHRPTHLRMCQHRRLLAFVVHGTGQGALVVLVEHLQCQ